MPVAVRAASSAAGTSTGLASRSNGAAASPATEEASAIPERARRPRAASAATTSTPGRWCWACSRRWSSAMDSSPPLDSVMLAADGLSGWKKPDASCFGSWRTLYTQRISGKSLASILGQKIVWLKEFQIFKDKSSAIDNGTGVSRELTEMISRCHHPCQKLAVGKPEYKTIIQTSLPGVHCLLDETVMEVMWGLKHLMHSLVPQEKLKLTKEDRLPMSQGLKMFLYHYGFDVKPELVNEQVVIAACLLRDAGLIVESHSEQLRWAAGQLKEVSGINPEGWSAMKTATALTIMFDPVEITDDEMEIFTEEEVSTLEMTCHKYEDIIYKDFSLKIHSELVEMREVKKDALGAPGFLLGSSM